MSYQKPDGLLLSKPSKRKTPKSAFLRKLEAKQKDAGVSAIAAAAKAAADAITVTAAPINQANKQRRVAALTVAYSRRREK